MNLLSQLQQELQSHANPEKAKILSGFFKTGPGQYGEGDIFLGITIPVQRSICKKYQLPLSDIKILLDSPLHEYRVCSLFILIKKYEKADLKEKKEIFDFYINSIQRINNWDLVDLSAPNIVGDYLLDKPRNILYELVRSDHLWKKRVAILANFTFIRNNDFDDILKIAEILLQDSHDLIQKAIGWMLREMGKRDEKILEDFLERYAHIMPRTMLRYSIERLSKEKKEKYMMAKLQHK